MVRRVCRRRKLGGIVNKENEGSDNVEAWNSRRQKKFKKSKGKLVSPRTRNKTVHYNLGCCQSEIINSEKDLNI